MISPAIIKRIRDNSFKVFAGKKFYFELYAFDWKYDKVLLGISEPLRFVEKDNRLVANNLRKASWLVSQEKFETPIVKTGTVTVIHLVNIKSGEIVYAVKPVETGGCGGEFFLSSVYLTEGSTVWIDRFTIKMEV
jgi:hypothetical protein